MQQFAFGPRNYKVMGLGLALLAAGFITMMFGDRANYGEDFAGITLGPLLLLTGFGVEFYAILLRDPAAIVSRGTTLREYVDPATGVPAGPGSAPVVGSPLGGPATPAAPAYKRL